MLTLRLTSAIVFTSPTLTSFIIVVVAPLTPQTPWETISTTSFDARVSSASTKLVLFRPPSCNVPSGAVEKSIFTLVRLVPHVEVLKISPNYPFIVIVYEPTAYPSGLSVALMAKHLIVYSM